MQLIVSKSHYSTMEEPLNITFSWMGPLLDLGKRKTLDLHDLVKSLVLTTWKLIIITAILQNMHILKLHGWELYHLTGY
ncbi:hypothetical protein ACJX0J_031548, partial [Zea mays]